MPSGALLLCVALCLGGASGARAAKYVDTQERFSLDKPSGWRLTPMPGDTSGMTFKKEAGDAFVLLRVSVRAARDGETPEESLQQATAPLRAEIGFEKGPTLPASVGLLPATSRSLTVFASGDRRTVRDIRLYVLHAFGHVHTLHVETLKQHRRRFVRDVDRMVASYKPLAGRALQAPLVATWNSEADGPDLVLEETGAFSLGPLKGTWRADGGQLTLAVNGGREVYRYVQSGNALLLKSPNLDTPQRYLRAGAARFGPEDKEPAKSGRLSRGDLVGRWRALDTASTEPLVLHLAATGSVSFGPLAGRWWFKRGLLTIKSTAGRTVTYHVSPARGGAQIVLGGGDLDREMRLERE